MGTHPTYECFYGRGIGGGHAGPFHTLGDALKHATNYVYGMQPRHSCMVEIVPREAAHQREKWQVILDLHKCTCGLCGFFGETFLHVRRLQTQA